MTHDQDPHPPSSSRNDRHDIPGADQSARAAYEEATQRQLQQFAHWVKLATPRVWVTPVLLALNLLAFAWLVFIGAGFGEFDPRALVFMGANFGPLTINGQSWRLFTSMFLHGGILHLALNMWALWSVGRQVERLYGNGLFTFIYVVAGIGGSLASLLWGPERLSVGASGAIFGVFGAFIVFFMRRDTALPPDIARANRSNLVVLAILNLIFGASVPGIDNAAHVGGLICGLALGWLLARPMDPQLRSRTPWLRFGAALGLTLLMLYGGYSHIMKMRTRPAGDGISVQIHDSSGFGPATLETHRS